MQTDLTTTLTAERLNFHPVVSFFPGENKIASIDLSIENKNLAQEHWQGREVLHRYIFSRMEEHDLTYLIGGYDENRAIYGRSELFGKKISKVQNLEEPRTLHLGMDIWGKTGLAICAPVKGKVHSFGFNDHKGDYGSTIILSHSLPGAKFYSLYGHLSLDDIDGLSVGKSIDKGECFAHFGKPEENGDWPPHLHFQLIENIGAYAGDYPGVCKMSERSAWLRNSPDPDLVLNMRKFTQTQVL